MPGDDVFVTYFEPETTHGEVKERTATFAESDRPAHRAGRASARAANVVRFNAPPTPATDASWTPEVEGITDKDMRDWDALLVRPSLIRPEDDDYWNEVPHHAQGVHLARRGSKNSGPVASATSRRSAFPRPMASPRRRWRCEVKVDPADPAWRFNRSTRAGIAGRAARRSSSNCFSASAFHHRRGHDAHRDSGPPGARAAASESAFSGRRLAAGTCGDDCLGRGRDSRVDRRRHRRSRRHRLLPGDALRVTNPRWWLGAIGRRVLRCTSIQCRSSLGLSAAR